MFVYTESWVLRPPDVESNPVMGQPFNGTWSIPPGKDGAPEKVACGPQMRRAAGEDIGSYSLVLLCSYVMTKPGKIHAAGQFGGHQRRPQVSPII